MATPQEQYAAAFGSLTNRFSIIFALRRVAEVGLPNAIPEIYEDWLRFAHDLFNEPENEKFFNDKEGALKASGGVEGMGKSMAENQLKMFKTAIDAASLVFAHSVVDSSLLDFLRVTVAHNHLDWSAFVDDKQIAVSAVQGKTYDDIVKDKVREYVESLDRQSLLMKIDRMFQVCRPPAGFEPMNDYKFDRGRLEKLDKLRHDIVHGPGPVTPLENSDDEIWYLHKTTFYFFAMVNERYDTRIDPKLMFTQPGNGA